MADSSHNIIIGVDASSGRAELRSLTQSIQSTSAALRQLGSAGGGNAFASLSRSLGDTSRGFESLKRATRDNGLAEFNQSISALSRGMPTAAREIAALASAFIVNRNAVALFAGALGTVGLGKFASDSMTAGTAALNLKIAVDSVAAGSGEAGRALTFIRQTALNLGQPLDVATKQFAAFYTSARSLGKSPEVIENVWRGLSTAMSALHVSRQDQAVFMKELQETYSMGKIDATRLIRSMSVHLPGLSASMSQALGISGAEMHHRFKNGGLSVDSWEKLATLLEKRYGGAVKESLDHAQGSVIALSNSFELLKQKSFDNGIDSAVAGLANTINGILKPNVDSIASALGTAFQYGSAGVQLLIQKLYELRQPLTTIGTILAGYAAFQATFAILGAGIAFLLRPIGLAVAAGALLYATWDSFEPTAQKLAAIFSAIGDRLAELGKKISDATRGWIDFGSWASWAGDKASAAWSWMTGGVDKLADKAGYKAGTDYLSGITSSASNLTKKLWGSVESSVPDFLKPTTLVDDYKRLVDATSSKAFTQHGDYESNRARYDTKDLSLGDDLEKVFSKLSPTTAALKTYREELEKIAQMKGRIDPLGRTIDDAAIKRLKDSARADAFDSAFPMASKIQDKLDELKAYSDHAGKFGKADRDTEREVLRDVNALKRKGADISDEEVDTLRKIINLEKEIAKGGSDGFTQWANSQKSAVESLNDNIKSSMDSVADGIAKIATTGKGQFHSLGAAIRDELRSILSSTASNFLRSGIKSLMAEGIKGLDLGDIKSRLADAINGGDSIVKKANSELDRLSSDALKSVANMDVQASVVNLNGASLSGASGLAAFSPSGANPAAVGGGSNGSLGSITSNSVGEFGKLIDTQSKRLGSGLDLQSQALALASSMEGKHEVRNNSDVNAFLRKGGVDIDAAQTKWCAAFVNSSLAQAGIKGDGSLTANMFRQWGKPVNLDDGVKAGDVLVESKGHGFGPGGHVGFATGESRMGSRGLELKRLSGNLSNKVGEDWIRADLLNVRRATQRIDGRSLDSGENKLKEGRSAFADDTARESVLERQMREQREREKASRSRPDSSADIGRQSNSTANDLAGLGTSIAKLGASGKATAPAIVSVAESVLKLLSNLASSAGGGGSGGAGGGLGSIVSAGASLLGGLFSEGGYVGSPVSSASMPASFWAGAPQFREGGVTNGANGAIPILAHPGEAIVPLSRGRSIPVELSGGASGGDTYITNNLHSNVKLTEGDSFRRSPNQMAAEMHKMMGRIAARNN